MKNILRSLRKCAMKPWGNVSLCQHVPFVLKLCIAVMAKEYIYASQSSSMQLLHSSRQQTNGKGQQSWQGKSGIMHYPCQGVKLTWSLAGLNCPALVQYVLSDNSTTNKVEFCCCAVCLSQSVMLKCLSVKKSCLSKSCRLEPGRSATNISHLAMAPLLQPQPLSIKIFTPFLRNVWRGQKVHQVCHQDG